MDKGLLLFILSHILTRLGHLQSLLCMLLKLMMLLSHFVNNVCYPGIFALQGKFLTLVPIVQVGFTPS